MKSKIIGLFIVFALGNICIDNGLLSMTGDLPVIIRDASGINCPDGRLEVNPINGISPYSYKWYNFNDPSIILSNDNYLGNVLPGNYCVEVKDLYGGEVCACFTVGINQSIILIKELKFLTQCEIINSHCISDNDGVIEIDVNYHGNYYILWDDGVTTKRREGLGFGDYSVIITNDLGCVIGTASFAMCCCTVSGPGQSSTCPKCNTGIMNPLSVSSQIRKETSQNAKDGSIVLTVNGGLTNKYYYWTGPNGFKSSQKDIYHLTAGRYCIKIQDGCNYYENCFDVSICELNDVPLPTGTWRYLYSCPDQSTGWIIFDNTNYTYNWNNGSTSRLRTNLAKGTYNVTITNPSNSCSIAKQIEIGDLPRIRIESEKIKSACNGSNDGEIELNFILGFFPEVNNAYWEDNPSLIISPSNDYNMLVKRTSLAPGNYCIIYDDGCNSPLRKCYEVRASSLDVTYSSSLDCQSSQFTGSIDLNVIGNGSPFNYHWSNGSSSEDQTGLVLGTYQVTITDQGGCSKVLNIDLRPIIEIERVNPCKGLWNGKYVFQINNPNHYPINVYYNFSPCSDCLPFVKVENDIRDPIIITLEQLIGNFTYHFGIQYGNCYLVYSFTLNEIGLEEVYKSFVDPDCVYDLKCQGELIISEGLKKSPRLEREFPCEPGVIFKHCPDMLLFCDGNPNKVKTIESRGTIFMRRGEVQAYYERIYGHDFIPESIQGNPCDLMWICDSDPLCVQLNTHGLGGSNNGQEYLGNGCWRIKCKLIWLFSTSFIICEDNYIPDNYRPYIKPKIKPICEHPVTTSMATFCDDYIFGVLDARFGQSFDNSDLDNFLNENCGKVEKLCAIVEYCADDFKVLYSNIDKVKCIHLDPPYITPTGFPFTNTCEGIKVESNDVYVICLCDDYNENMTPEEIRDCLQIKQIDPDGKIRLIPRIPTRYQFLSRSPNSIKFENFSFTNLDSGYIYPNEISRSNNRYYLTSFYPDKPERLTDTINENITFFYRDFTNELLFLCEINDSSNYSFYVGRLDSISIYNINSSGYLKVDKVEQTAKGLIIYTRFTGELSIQDQQSFNAPDTSLLIFSYNSQTKNLSINKISGFENAMYTNNSFLLNTSESHPINLNSESIPFTNNTSAIEFQLTDSTLSPLNNQLLFSPNYKIVAFENVVELNCKYYLLKGIGNLSLNNIGLFYPGDNAERFILLKNTSGSISLVKSFSSEGIIENVIFKAYESGFLFGLNISGHNDLMSNEDFQYPPINSDIFIIEFDSLGNQVNYNRFGTSNNEEVVLELYKNIDSTIFIGGNIYGTNNEIEIGEMNFIKQDGNFTKPFTSYMIAGKNYNSTSQALILDTNYKKISSVNSLTILPNPADDYIRLLLSNDLKAPKELLIIDYKGGIVKSIKLTSQDFKESKLDININNLQNGIYVIKLTTIDGKIISSKFIKHSSHD